MQSFEILEKMVAESAGTVEIFSYLCSIKESAQRKESIKNFLQLIQGRKKEYKLWVSKKDEDLKFMQLLGEVIDLAESEGLSTENLALGLDIRLHSEDLLFLQDESEWDKLKYSAPIIHLCMSLDIYDEGSDTQVQFENAFSALQYIFKEQPPRRISYLVCNLGKPGDALYDFISWLFKECKGDAWYIRVGRRTPYWETRRRLRDEFNFFGNVGTALHRIPDPPR